MRVGCAHSADRRPGSCHRPASAQRIVGPVGDAHDDQGLATRLPAAGDPHPPKPGTKYTTQTTGGQIRRSPRRWSDPCRRNGDSSDATQAPASRTAKSWPPWSGSCRALPNPPGTRTLQMAQVGERGRALEPSSHSPRSLENCGRIAKLRTNNVCAEEVPDGSDGADLPTGVKEEPLLPAGTRRATRPCISRRRTTWLGDQNPTWVIRSVHI